MLQSALTYDVQTSIVSDNVSVLRDQYSTPQLSVIIADVRGHDCETLWHWLPLKIWYFNLDASLCKGVDIPEVVECLVNEPESGASSVAEKRWICATKGYNLFRLWD